MANIWNGYEVNLEPLRGNTIAIIGYGNQGVVQSNNLRKSGFNIIIGLRKNSVHWEAAKKDGHYVVSIEEAVKASNIIHILISDAAQAEVYKKSILPNLTEGKILSFSHAASVFWKWIEPPKNTDVILVAPKATSVELYNDYDHGSILFAVSTYPSNNKKILDKAISLAAAIGGKNSKIMEVSFKEEVIVNWFAEQTVLCGGVTSMIMNAFDVLVSARYNADVAYFEVLHELKLIIDLVQRYGIAGMYSRVSETARYGGLTRGPFVMDKHVKENMKKILVDNENGNFERELMVQSMDNKSAKMLDEIKSHKIEKVGKEMRKMMGYE